MNKSTDTHTRWHTPARLTTEQRETKTHAMADCFRVLLVLMAVESNRKPYPSSENKTGMANAQTAERGKGIGRKVTIFSFHA